MATIILHFSFISYYIVTKVTQSNVEAKVDDQYVIESNTGILYCKLHSHLSDYVSILFWIRSDGLVIKPYTLTGTLYLIFDPARLITDHLYI